MIMVVTSWILGGWLPFLYVFFGMFVLGILLALIIDYRLYLRFLTMKTTKKGMSMGMSILMTIVFCVSAAYLSLRFDKSFDITEEKINSLAPQTIQLLKKLDGDLVFQVFYKGGEGAKKKALVKNHLSLFKQTSSRVKDHYYNAHLRNALAQKYLNNLSNRERESVFVFAEYKGKRVQVELPFNEEKLTGSIIKVTRRKERVVYFLSGHGERNLTEELSSLREALLQSSFQVKTWNFIKDGFSLPSDLAVLLIISPTRSMLKGELEKLKTFLQNGGRMLLALDPDRSKTTPLGKKQKLVKKPEPSIKDLIKDFGIRYTEHYVVSRTQQVVGLGPLSVLGIHFDYTSPITRSFDRGAFVIFHIASPLKVIDASNKQFAITKLIKTNVDALSIPHLKKNQIAGKPTSHVLAALVKSQATPLNDKKEPPQDQSTQNKTVKTEKKPKTKKKNMLLAVFGDSDFMTNQFFQTNTGWNRDVIMNTISLLVDESDLIGIRPKKLKATQLILKQSDKIGIVVFSIMLPCIFFIISGLIWFRRRGA